MPQSNITERLTFSVNETLALLGISRGTLYKLVKGGELQSITIRRRRFFTPEALNALIAKAGDATRGRDQVAA